MHQHIQYGFLSSWPHPSQTWLFDPWHAHLIAYFPEIGSFPGVGYSIVYLTRPFQVKNYFSWGIKQKNAGILTNAPIFCIPTSVHHPPRGCPSDSIMADILARTLQRTNRLRLCPAFPVSQWPDHSERAQTLHIQQRVAAPDFNRISLSPHLSIFWENSHRGWRHAAYWISNHFRMICLHYIKKKKKINYSHKKYIFYTILI